MVEKQVKSLSLGSTYGYANKLPQVTVLDSLLHEIFSFW